MAYCSQAQIEELYGADLIEGLTDDAGAGVADADVITAVIADASREIDGYCRAKYAVPFTGTIPPMVVTIAIVLSVWRMYRRRTQSFGMPEDVQADYEMRIKQLERINAGTLDLGVEPPPAASGRSNIRSDGPGRLFTDHSNAEDGESTLDGF
jgi:phage gp36-like protein